MLSFSKGEVVLQI